MFSDSLKSSLLHCSIVMQNHMNNILPEGFGDSRLLEAMRYSALSEGKRIRPFLILASARIFGIEPHLALNAAAAMEFVHCYSLIHDDLPAMDNDDFRRGKPTCHKKFDEATAILAGDALLTYAFEILSDVETHQDPGIRCELIKILSKASGFAGMAGGQMIDLEKANKKISKEEIAGLHRLKTGELFMASAEMGAVIGRASLDNRKSLRYYAHDLGLAFQIKDDILDHAGLDVSRSAIDEKAHKKAQDNASIVDLVGIDIAKSQLEILKSQAIAHLRPFGEKAKLLAELVDFVVSREV
jgi:farnesyl diphosphate synthase